MQTEKKIPTPDWIFGPSEVKRWIDPLIDGKVAWRIGKLVFTGHDSIHDCILRENT